MEEETEEKEEELPVDGHTCTQGRGHRVGARSRRGVGRGDRAHRAGRARALPGAQGQRVAVARGADGARRPGHPVLALPRGHGDRVAFARLDPHARPRHQRHVARDAAVRDDEHLSVHVFLLYVSEPVKRGVHRDACSDA